MDSDEIERMLQAAHVAVLHARDVRASYRKRAGKRDRQRQTDIQLALNRLKRVMQPMRSELARIPYSRKLDRHIPGVYDLEERRERLLAASSDIQRERRKLWKMQDRKS